MNIFSKLFRRPEWPSVGVASVMRALLAVRSRDKPKNSYHFSGWPFVFGKSAAGKNVNEFTAMQTTAVYACVRILAESIAGLPLHVYE